ncbi:uncharacterized protein LOC142503149 isoform X2 [Ascaphus truei]|uniref:uncharacterized protein LOC142503149 isoform X2 n=1 Tax=Ascaphus truei TaxID=8439 RepID=UPI003F5A90FC
MSPGLGVRHIYSARARRGRGQGTILKTSGTETGGRHVIKSRAPLGGGFIMMSPLSHSVTSHSAFVLLYFVALISGTRVPAADSRITTLQVSWRRILRTLQESVQRQKRQADRLRQQECKYKPGDKVWLSLRNIRLKTPSPKLAPSLLVTDLAWLRTLSGFGPLTSDSTTLPSPPLGLGKRTQDYACLSSPRTRQTDTHYAALSAPRTLAYGLDYATLWNPRSGKYPTNLSLQPKTRLRSVPQSGLAPVAAGVWVLPSPPQYRGLVRFASSTSVTLSPPAIQAPDSPVLAQDAGTQAVLQYPSCSNTLASLKLSSPDSEWTHRHQAW